MILMMNGTSLQAQGWCRTFRGRNRKAEICKYPYLRRGLTRPELHDKAFPLDPLTNTFSILLNEILFCPRRMIILNLSQTVKKFQARIIP